MVEIKQGTAYAVPCFGVVVISWGICPKPGHKKLFEKSFLEPQKLR